MKLISCNRKRLVEVIIKIYKKGEIKMLEIRMAEKEDVAKIVKIEVKINI